MSNQDSTSEFDKALDLMESSSDSSDKKWEDLKDVETLDACKDLMDVRYLLHKCQASGMVDVEAELARLKGRQNRKKKSGNNKYLFLLIRLFLIILAKLHLLIIRMT